ncbi:HvfA family oxazolone/thioamide-modified RiPP metallophore [Thiohalophilus thiocyanatoxydans]|uniref:Putative low-complexity protein n=1 Tax=Thiohalophilus thiocyanatoxydans TaxID=381308 RepID=A0A4R8ISH7_9GAMM|nr:low-complexity protein [Thiohalophilus thiocyanatoxydans]TDY03926.1 putative low-complexity protein [Thiohalophilus thiocyanatoxydans]
MSHSNKTLKSVSWAVGATLATTLAASNIASAATPASDNPFAMSELDNGYMLLAEKGSEGKCGEGKCGEGKSADAKTQEGKCGEGKCGAQSEKKDKDAEGKCGEGKCGSN